jgi:hypothetical protein
VRRRWRFNRGRGKPEESEGREDDDDEEEEEEEQEEEKEEERDIPLHEISTCASESFRVPLPAFKQTSVTLAPDNSVHNMYPLAPIKLAPLTLVPPHIMVTSAHQVLAHVNTRFFGTY